ncbi:hypothetical protein COLU111180_03170 [Cohnella lubricantis]|uniref:Uncharacterized protein n=1 Tax=Cohnella lubricantis TaxID=2163172 RepID=A0A841T7U7_9BACL|nr:hypothetical protein [Cohnella lubricantis]MBB6677394.1 hypothetical protein [Cohnella lubricantis]MBP2118715.1 hypothetical protein [Cohnella lubricantis]
MSRLKTLNKTISQMLDNIGELVASGKLDGKEVILFGVVRELHHIVHFLTSKGIKIAAFIDNSPRKIGKAYAGIGVYSPESYLNPKKSNVAILICSAMYQQEQSIQIRSLGYVKNIDYFTAYKFKKPKTPLFLREIQSLKRIVSGYYIYKRIMNGLPKNATMLLCPYAGSGDAYLIGMYLKNYIKKENIDHYIIVANGNLVKKVVKLFSFENVVVINPSQKDKLLAAYQFLNSEKMKVKPLLFWDWRVKRNINVNRDILPLSFKDDFKYGVFELDESVVASSPIFNENEREVDAFFDKYGLIKGKTVILAPYMGAYNGMLISYQMWEQIVNGLKSKGYSVCTNSIGVEEPPIQGTQAVFFPLDMSVPIMDAAGGFIGIRSGFCDVISSSTCNMVVIYESVTNVIPIHYFGLKHMGLNDNAIEFEYDGTDDEAFVSQVLSHF